MCSQYCSHDLIPQVHPVLKPCSFLNVSLPHLKENAKEDWVEKDLNSELGNVDLYKLLGHTVETDKYSKQLSGDNSVTRIRKYPDRGDN